MNENEEELPSFKIVMLGPSGVGKTSIINRYIKQSFEKETLSSTGVCFNSKTLTYPETKESCKIDVKIYLNIFYIQLWDTAGQERYKSITRIYYQNSDSIIFVYDITDNKSYESLKSIYEDVKERIDISKVLVYIVGNKIDRYDAIEVKREEAEEYAKSINGNFRLVSALNCAGIKELFEEIGRTLIDNNKEEPKPEINQAENMTNIELKTDDIKLPKKKRCCK